jgi:hypothetical protein
MPYLEVAIRDLKTIYSSAGLGKSRPAVRMVVLLRGLCVWVKDFKDPKDGKDVRDQ